VLLCAALRIPRFRGRSRDSALILHCGVPGTQYRARTRLGIVSPELEGRSEPFGTIYSWVAELGTGEVHVAHGRLCEDEFEVVEL